MRNIKLLTNNVMMYLFVLEILPFITYYMPWKHLLLTYNLNVS